ncbi:hypothetical protein QBC43DRAFT_284337 [Cladorrhinum sp. PSN259]|nr:hypothetical protein QBC43DRAFT_284337 [Cladorrhinum sp. PSN259]
MTLGLAASRHNPNRGEAEGAQRGDGGEQPSATKSLKNVLNNSNKAADKAGKSVKIAPDTTDKTTATAPAVTHEVVKPKVHEVLHEQIERDIHEHHVVQKIQPVIDVEVLPARHYVPGPDGRLAEVAEKDLPECTGENQNWHVGEGSLTGNIQCSAASKEAPGAVPSEGMGRKYAGAQENITPELQEGSQPVQRNAVHRTENTVVHTTVAGTRQER